MKKIKLVFSLVAALFVASACTDFVEPAIPYNGFETGTYLKTITAPASINFFDLANSPFKVLLECHAVDKINNVKNVDIYVNHRRGNTVTKEVLLTNIDGSAFTTTADSKWPRGTINVPMATTLSKLGFSTTNLRGGDFIEYRLVLTTLDGKTFSNNNMSSNINDPYYASPFFYRVAVVCPSNLAGTYDYTTTNITGSVADGANPAACGTGVSGKVTLTATSTAGEYTVSDGTFGQYACAWNDNPATGSIRFTDACGKIGMKGTDQYGLAYSLTYISNTATELKFKWQNNFGDSGITTLKRSSGSWPNGLN
ncbi:hypothetical protein [Lacihabitans soyangensis]|uniref:DUF1735 domain-containing protein n=1 Tax=Lacihabitans soyangensis TaxID=869394 RepID=A0AAE3KS56_9BACT|nr:hypothetical protein [Lacihabitans soyangensis]MCP9762743.1 hypothetical protein [Lacihabitans soyangensis]